MEAVKQGPATIGLRSNTHAVLVSLTVSFKGLLWFELFRSHFSLANLAKPT